jgi:hypothetical protein
MFGRGMELKQYDATIKQLLQRKQDAARNKHKDYGQELSDILRQIGGYYDG